MNIRNAFVGLVAVVTATVPGVGYANDLIVGRATVVDGDTIEINGTRIRFGGIDAPESWQLCSLKTGEQYQCGRNASLALDDFLSKAQPTTCEQTDTDLYGRTVANCFRADGEDVSNWMVGSGNAVDLPKYSHGAFSGFQDTAKVGGLGIWQGAFELPCVARAKRSHRKPFC